MPIKKKIIIQGGKVHGVGYRLFLMEKAQELCIPNFHPKNTKIQGKEAVEVLVGGEKAQIESFLDFARKNFPENSDVESVSAEEYTGEVMSLDAFSRIFSASQLTKLVQAGVAMVGGQDKMLHGQDKMLEKQDKMLEKQDETVKVLGGKIDKLGENLGNKIDNVGVKIDKGFGKTDQNFTRMDVKYDKVSDKMDSIDKTLQKLTSAILKLAERA